jgi:hypothetical protein
MSFKSHTLIDETVAAAVTTTLVSFPGEYRLAFQVVWTGTLAATVVVQSSVDSETWTATAVTESPAGSPGNGFTELPTGAPYFRAVVTGVTGTGNLKVVAHGKG